MNGTAKREECEHFMARDCWGGYSIYRCHKCTYFDGKKTFNQMQIDLLGEILKHQYERELQPGYSIYVVNSDVITERLNKLKKELE